MPTVPIRKKPKLQIIIVITEVAILVAAKYFVSPKFPIKPVSTIPTKGMAMFEKKTGIDNKIICFFENFDVLLNSSILFFNISQEPYIH